MSSTLNSSVEHDEHPAPTESQPDIKDSSSTELSIKSAEHQLPIEMWARIFASPYQPKQGWNPKLENSIALTSKSFYSIASPLRFKVITLHDRPFRDPGPETKQTLESLKERNGFFKENPAIGWNVETLKVDFLWKVDSQDEVIKDQFEVILPSLKSIKRLEISRFWHLRSRRDVALMTERLNQIFNVTFSTLTTLHIPGRTSFSST